MIPTSMARVEIPYEGLMEVGDELEVLVEVFCGGARIDVASCDKLK